MKAVVVVALLNVFLVGCSGVQMTPIESNDVKTLSMDKSRVIFLRSSVVAEVSDLMLVDVTSGEPELIGVLNNETRVSFDVDPGKHTFMLVAETVDFLNAELKPGLTYYSLVEPVGSGLRAYFSIWPIRSDPDAVYSVESKEFRQWLRDTIPVENNQDSLQWFEDNREVIIAKYQQYWPEWNTQATLDIERQSLLPEDGQKY